MVSFCTLGRNFLSSYCNGSQLFRLVPPLQTLKNNWSIWQCTMETRNSIISKISFFSNWGWKWMKTVEIWSFFARISKMTKITMSARLTSILDGWKCNIIEIEINHQNSISIAFWSIIESETLPWYSTYSFFLFTVKDKTCFILESWKYSTIKIILALIEIRSVIFEMLRK